MESTAQYWKPVWMELEPHMKLHLAQAQSNKAPKGRKSDLADAKRLVRRFAAGELMLSFIPEPAQRSWRMVTRGRLQLVRSRHDGSASKVQIRASSCSIRKGHSWPSGRHRQASLNVMRLSNTGANISQP